MRSFITLILLVISLPIFATVYPALIQTNNLQGTIAQFNSMKLDIDRVWEHQIRVYLNDSQYNELSSMGYYITKLRDQAKEYADSLFEATKNSRNPLSQYYSYDEYVSFMQDIAQEHPDIVQLVNAGTTIQTDKYSLLRSLITLTLKKMNPKSNLPLLSTVMKSLVTIY